MPRISKSGAVKIGLGYRIRIRLDVPIDTPIVDATQDLELAVRKSDLANARVRDAGACGYAKAICRATGAPSVLVCRGTTLVVGHKDGKLVIFRYRSSPMMKLRMSKFDLNARMDTHKFTLAAPQGKFKIEYRNEHGRNYREEVKAGTRKVKHTGRRIGWDDHVGLRPVMQSLPV